MYSSTFRSPTRKGVGSFFYGKNMTDGKLQNLTITEVKPKLYAQKCPTCNGFGTLKYGSLKCNGCNGKTWILIPIE